MDKTTYCCERFHSVVKSKAIIKADKNDETEWFIPSLWHIYFCPFCGASVKGKGKGWGQYTDKKQSKK
jgi:hypothetical protein